VKPCIVCGEPSEQPRCPEHRTDYKPPAAARGYDAKWKRLSRRARRAQPWCSDCGTTEGLQTDHSPGAWQRKTRGLEVRLCDVDVVCGPCNRARGAARGVTARPGG
jgi:hypothetical protein